MLAGICSAWLFYVHLVELVMRGGGVGLVIRGIRSVVNGKGMYGRNRLKSENHKDTCMVLNAA